jgi:catechol 2,3-dioxygenase-like lactoylglutathione lyase family enzyme
MRARRRMQAGAQAHQDSSLKGKTMKRLHVHVAVNDIPQSIGFYSALFAAQPAVVKTDYAKWMLDDPRVNFAISTRGREPGLDHLGIQVEDAGELNEVYARLRQAGGNIIEQGQTACCYAKSEKSWIDDPAGISWETFLTTGESINYGDGTGENTARVAHEKQSACGVPQPVAAPAVSACCTS